MKVSIANKTHFPDEKVFWFIIAKDSSGNFFHVSRDGSFKTVSTADNKNSITVCNQTQTYANYSYSVKETPVINIADGAYANSGQIYISIADYLPIRVLSQTALQLPSVSNPCVPGYYTIWEFAEFALGVPGPGSGLFFDTTSVDFMGIPITAEVKSKGGDSSTVGFTATRSELIKAFQACPDSNFASLIIPGQNPGDLPLRILSPEHAMSSVPSLPTKVVEYFNSFMDAYIKESWSHYKSPNSLTVQIVAGDSSTIYTGQVNASNQFVFYQGNSPSGTKVATVNRPTTMEVLNCNGSLVAGDAVAQNIEKFIAAAMNRTVFERFPPGSAPSWCSLAANYYTKPPIEYYPKILHDHSINKLCYGFAFDDVCDQSSSIHTTTPSELVLTLPAWS